MSASTKKKIRKEQNAAALTEKQLNERKEAKKLKASSLAFAILMIVILAVGLTVMVFRGVQGSGIIEKNTVAATIGDHELNSVTMSYYYADTVSNTYNSWTSMYGDATATYLSMLGLDLTLPLDEQPHYDGEGTWADYFMETALDRARADYAVYDIAMAEGYTLSSEANLNLESTVNYKDLYAMYGGYTDVDDYMVSFYGPGADRDSYYEYAKISAIASAYYNDYSAALEYTDADIRAHEAGNEQNYNSYTYASYYLGYAKYLEEGTTDPSAEQIATAAAMAEVDAAKLVEATTIEELDAAIAELEVNAETANVTSTKNENMLYTSVNSVVRDWVSSSSREEGDIAMIPNNVTSTDENGNETTALNGYYVVLFQGSNSNTEPMDDVRHLLVKFEGGTQDESGNMVYTDEEKAAAKEKAEGYLNTWRSGDATEETFIELASQYSVDSSAENGGLIAGIHAGSSYVPTFLDWSTDPDRKVGDTDIIESMYGYHVMYYVGENALSYRDSLITEELRNADLDEWYLGAIEGITITKGNLSRIETGMVLAG